MIRNWQLKFRLENKILKIILNFEKVQTFFKKKCLYRNGKSYSQCI